MSWINSRQFTISNRNGRHYVFRRSNAGNTEINIPASIVSKGQAIAWLKAHPNKVANPTRHKAKRGAPQPGGLKPFERMVNGKKMIAFVNKEGKEYFRPAPGKEPNYFVNRNRAQGKKVKNTYTCDGLKSACKSMKVIGKGRQGIVFLASRYSNGRYPFAIKVVPRDLRAVKRKEEQPGDVEFNIQNAVMEAAPDGVVGVRQLLKCDNFVRPVQINMANVQKSGEYDKSKQTVITMEYASGGSLRSWIDKQPRITEGMVHDIISTIIKTLGKIQKKYPDFRHNDLHLENVFVADRGFLIGDFGWSRLEKMGTNPAVNTANGTSIAGRWGLGPKTDARYDSHLFLAEILGVVKRMGGAEKFPHAMAFLNVAVPAGYRAKSDVHTTEGRLKYGDPCPGLPTLDRILKSKYLTGRSPNVPSPAKPKAKPKPRPKALSASPVKRRASNRLVRSASARAGRGRLLYANSQLMAISPRSFLKLSAANKARATALRKGKGKAGNVNRRRQAVKPMGPVAKDGPVKDIAIPRAVIKNAKFNRMVEKIWKNAGAKSGAEFNNAWSNARRRAMNVIKNRIGNNKAPFSPSPGRLPSPLSPLGPPPKPKPKPKAPSPPKPKAPSPPKPKPKNLNAAAKRMRQHAASLAAKRPKLLVTTKPPSPPKAKNSNFKLSPSSGRAKVKSNASGRWVYANLHFSMEQLKRMAANKGLNTKGLRSKANIARKIFGSV
jgi:serine/threonine protein kinase